MHTSKVGRIFVCETEQCLMALKNDYRRICPLRHSVGEIELCYLKVVSKLVSKKINLDGVRPLEV